VTNEKYLKSRTFEGVDPDYSPFQIPPTPQTAKRKRVEKLRRHLGEPIPYDAVYDHVVPPSRSADPKSQDFEIVQTPEVATYVRAVVTTGRLLYFSSNDRDPYEGGYEGDSECSHGQSNESWDSSCEVGEKTRRPASPEDYTWVLENGTAFRTNAKPYSCKWVFDKRGRRNTEADYERILEVLRVL
jgi:hypothetical protein